MKLDELREEMNGIDSELLELFKRRMDVAREIGAVKKEEGLPIHNKEREREILCRLTENLDADFTNYVQVFFQTLFEMSRSYQAKCNMPKSHNIELIEEAIQNTPQTFPERAIVACQGTEGAYSQSACEKLFSLANIMYFDSFEGVFQAVEGGLCRYGILPLENSSAGSVNEVYDLMSRYNFYITRSVRLKINHMLLAPAGVKLNQVKEIFSHEQAISQCSRFLKTLNGVKVTACENTAVAAKRAAESGRNDVAVISSEECADIYGLSVLSYNIQNTDNNYTRFICIAKTPEIYPGAHKTSLKLSLKHQPGALHNVIAKFNVLGINMNKIESRPVPGSDFEFMFYFDIDASVYSDTFKQIIMELEHETAMFEYLGSYQEL